MALCMHLIYLKVDSIQSSIIFLQRVIYISLLSRIKTCLTAAQDRKGLTPVVVACNMKLSIRRLSAILPVHINATSAVKR
jgi:hypothetical protein